MISQKSQSTVEITHSRFAYGENRYRCVGTITKNKFGKPVYTHCARLLYKMARSLCPPRSAGGYSSRSFSQPILYSVWHPYGVTLRPRKEFRVEHVSRSLSVTRNQQNEDHSLSSPVGWYGGAF